MRQLIITKSDLSIANCVSLCASVLAIVGSMMLYIHIQTGLALLLLSLVGDILDGWLAHQYPSNSKLGPILDAFTDVVLYVVPVCIMIMMYYDISSITTMITSIFIISSLLRLAVFTNGGFIQESHSRYYQGMPVYFNHLIILLTLSQLSLGYISIIMVLSSRLMLSTYRFTKFGLGASLLWVIILGGGFLLLI